MYQLLMQTKNQPSLRSDTMQVRTPDGTLFLTVVENPDKTLNSFHITIGKAGAPIAAWSSAVSALMTLAVDKGAQIEDLLVALSNLSSDRVTYNSSGMCRSGPDGVWQGLMLYREGVRIIVPANERPRGARIGVWHRED